MTAKRIRIAFWALAALLGGAQTWYTRHRIFSDGISYLEIARQYASGDWHGALNAYWSPLYSWLVAAYLIVAQPSPYWEVSALHVVNFLMFLASCWIFEKFLGELIRARPTEGKGFSDRTLSIVGYMAILHGGLLMVGIGYVSPDMIACFLTGLAAWLTLRIARSESPGWYFAALGATLGLGYLDRTAFVPLSAVYILATGFLLVRQRAKGMGLAVLCAACVALIGAPFAIALTIQRGSFTMGESGRLNYGWEVDGAARTSNWQGEPGDIGKPAHPTRLILNSPVTVYEFGTPVPGSYPPWRDPSYWYQGIDPHLKLKEQWIVLMLNLRTTAVLLATTPAFVICLLTIVLGRGRGWAPRLRVPVYWALALPAAAGIAMYCLVFIDKRYIAGFLAVLWLTMLASLAIPEGRVSRYADLAAQTVAVVFLASMVVWLRPALLMSARDLLLGSESEYNVSWMMAQKYAEMGLKPGDRVAYVGSPISADWLRLAKVQAVAEVPVKWERGPKILNTVEANEQEPVRFFRLDEAEREKVYATFRSTGAVIAVTNRIPGGGAAGDWKPVLDPDDPRYPRAAGQMLDQSPGYYRWLNR